MAAMPIYGKTLKNLLLQTLESFEPESWYITLGTQSLLSFFFFSNDDTRMTFDLFTVWSNLCPSYCGITGRCCNSCFYQVSESWPMGLLFVLSSNVRVICI